MALEGQLKHLIPILNIKKEVNQILKSETLKDSLLLVATYFFTLKDADTKCSEHIISAL